MLARCSRTTPLSRIPNLSRSYSMAYIPHQATHDISPIETRPKPPSHFYTGKPNFYVALQRLETVAEQIEERLILARCPTEPAIRNDGANSWKTGDELELLLKVPKIRPVEYTKLADVLNKLVTLRQAADLSTDTSTVDQINLLTAPFAKRISSSVDRPAGGHKSRRAVDAAGRSHTTGTRKTSKAHVWMQFTPALAATFYNPAETERLAARQIVVEEARVQEEARKAAVRAAGSASLGPVFKYLDDRAAALLAKRKRDGLLPDPVMPPPKSPVEVLWDEEKDKKERFEKVARELLELQEKDKLESAGRSLNAVEEENKPEPTTTTTIITDTETTSSPPQDVDAPLAEGEIFVPPTQEQLWEEKLAAEIAMFDALKASRSSTPVASNSNSPDRSVPKDGTINVVNTTDAPPPSDPLLGQILINNVPFHRYFTNPKDREQIIRPLKVARLLGAFNIFALVPSGGPTGMAGAVSLGIARGIVVHQPMAKEALHAAMLLKVDNRMVERKKTGQPKARKKEKWVKR
ncbi:ribosomal protein S9/S16-domain-containing protein [Mrakia frigida]|uniref:mitochondrial 37S ribosomal protein uS9m MRPS9 n=1 Tax=Mrakia frigida TaxID=29902 RepID=UPI003FCBFAE4